MADKEEVEGQMKKTIVFAVAVLIVVVLMGCTKQILHTPNTNLQGDLHSMLYEMINQQPEAPVTLEVAGDAFQATVMVYAPNGQKVPKTITIYYDKVVSTEIVFKRYYRVLVQYTGGETKYRFLSHDEETAKKFVDVLFSLKEHAGENTGGTVAKPVEAEPLASPSAGCNPPCSPGYKCLEGVCEPQCNPPCGEGMVCGQDRTCQPASGN